MSEFDPAAYFKSRTGDLSNIKTKSITAAMDEKLGKLREYQNAVAAGLEGRPSGLVPPVFLVVHGAFAGRSGLGHHPATQTDRVGRGGTLALHG